MLGKLALRILLFSLAAATAVSPASACDCMRYIPDGPHFEQDIERLVSHATIVARGVITRKTVVRRNEQPDEVLVFEPSEVFKGRRHSRYLIHHVQYRTSRTIDEGCRVTIEVTAPWSMCDLAPSELETHVGRPTLLVLTGGPDIYQASRCANFQGADVDAAIVRPLIAGLLPQRR